MYDTTLGRFIQRDPLGNQAGVNPYLYVGGNPPNNLDPQGTVEHTTKCGKFEVDNMSTKNATIGGARAEFNVTITFETTQKCCCCEEIKMIQFAKTQIKTLWGWEIARPADYNKSVHNDANGWHVDAQKTGIWWYTGGTPTFGSCKPIRRDTIITDNPGTNVQAKFTFYTCAICTKGPGINELYGCIKWGFTIDARGRVSETNFPQGWGSPAQFNYDSAVRAWDQNEGNMIPIVTDCCTDSPQPRQPPLKPYPEHLNPGSRFG